MSSKIDHDAYKRLVAKGIPSDIAEELVSVFTELTASNGRTGLTKKQVLYWCALSVFGVIAFIDAIRYQGGIIYSIWEKAITAFNVVPK